MKSKKQFLSLISAIIVAFALISGCSSITVNQDYDPDFNFDQWKSYGFLPIPEAAGIDQLSADKLSNAIKRNLNAKGYKDSQPSDFGIALTFGKQTVTDIQSYGYGYGWYGGGVDVTQYQEGTLIVDFIDMKTNKLAWRGTAQGVLQDNPSMEDKTAAIDTAISQVLAPFPPDKTKQ